VKITVFTSNQPRHLSLIERLASISDEVFAVQECNTVFPGRVADFFRRSDVMQAYFSRVIAAEEEVFGAVRFAERNVRTLSIKSGDLSGVQMSFLAAALSSDIYVVFGASHIKAPLVEFLVENRTVNIHMGVSPYYRGSSCNFWALYDDNPDLVGATIHMLSRGLDSGGMLFHALPRRQEVDPFVLGMRAVRAAHDALADSIVTGRLLRLTPVAQNRAREIRYTRNSDFTDEVAGEYLARNLGAAEVGAKLGSSPARDLLDPHYG
jgi:folate-dependent phosphoribosylglycinamide formyltransferase PurN